LLTAHTLPINSIILNPLVEYSFTFPSQYFYAIDLFKNINLKTKEDLFLDLPRVQRRIFLSTHHFYPAVVENPQKLNAFLKKFKVAWIFGLIPHEIKSIF